MQILKSHARLAESESLSWELSVCNVTSPPGDSDAQGSLRITALGNPSDSIAMQDFEMPLRKHFFFFEVPRTRDRTWDLTCGKPVLNHCATSGRLS